MFGDALEALRGALLKVYMDRGITLRADASPKARPSPATARTSPEIAGNLLDNAFKWARTTVRITADRVVSPAARRDGSAMVIEDDGPGIPLDSRAQVLERGARLDERVAGQGIGLSVVRELRQPQRRHHRYRPVGSLGGARHSR